jgi:dolichol-phosphate mannosyltransferase
MTQAHNSKDNFISIVVPTYREVENIRLLVTRISRVLSTLRNAYEIIVVDDNSRDGIVEEVARLSEEDYPVRIIVRVGERGLSSAVIRGFRESRGNILICMDADLSHPPEAIPRMLECFMDTDVDFAIGSRYVPGASTEENWGVFRWLNSKTATLLAMPFAGIKDPMSGYFAIPRVVFDRAERLDPIGYKIALELIVKCSCKNIAEIPIHFANRKYGQSKLSLREQFNYLKHLKRLADFKWREFSLLFQFCLVGLTGMVVDIAFYSILLHVGVKLRLARALAIWLAMTWNFWLNRRLTFSYSRKGGLFKQYLRFTGSCRIGALMSWSTAVFLSQHVYMFSNHLFLAAIIGIIAGTISNFLLSRYWVFKKLSAVEDRSPQ